MEKYRFSSHATRYYKDILWLEKWQEEYLFLCDNNLRSFGDLVDYRIEAGEELDRIREEQKEIYRQNAALKRKCTTPAGDLEYQMEHLRNERRLERLKKRAKELRKGKGILEHHMARSINAYLERIGRTHPEESLVINPAVADVPEYPLSVERLRAELKRQEEQARQEAERQKQERFRKLYEEMREEGGRLHQKALDLPYGSKYMWEYIDYLDGRMFAPMEKFTIGELTEPFLTYEEFVGQKEKAEQRKREEMKKKKERDNAYSDWSSQSHQKIMDALENNYASRWFLEYSKYMDAEREKAKTEYSVKQLRQPVLSYEEFAERKEKEILADKTLDGDITSGQALKGVATEKALLRLVQERTAEDETVIRTKGDEAMEKIVTKQVYEQMTDKEKAEWIGIDESDVNGSIRRFKEKMGQIGIRYDSLPEMTDAFMEIQRAVERQTRFDYVKAIGKKI